MAALVIGSYSSAPAGAIWRFSADCGNERERLPSCHREPLACFLDGTNFSPQVT